MPLHSPLSNLPSPYAEPALGFHNAQDSSCREEAPGESRDGSGFAYEGIVVGGDSEELLRDPSPELQSSRPIAESSAAFDNLEVSRRLLACDWREAALLLWGE